MIYLLIKYVSTNERRNLFPASRKVINSFTLMVEQNDSYRMISTNDDGFYLLAGTGAGNRISLRRL